MYFQLYITTFYIYSFDAEQNRIAPVLRYFQSLTFTLDASIYDREASFCCTVFRGMKLQNIGKIYGTYIYIITI